MRTQAVKYKLSASLHYLQVYANLHKRCCMSVVLQGFAHVRTIIIIIASMPLTGA